MLFMVAGRQMPEGFRYVDSWIEPNFDRCFQVMGTADPALLQKWILAWETRALVEASLD
jgi:hypothetical protein